MHPGPSFSTVPIQPDTQVSGPGTFFVRSPFFSYVEYSTSSAHYFFVDSAESNADVEVGAVTSDDDAEASAPARTAPKRKAKDRKKAPRKRPR